jgi:hypothetical protein
MASLVLNGNTSGSVTISSPAVSGTTTLTLPTTSGTVLTSASSQVTGPAFSAYINVGQTISNNTATKLQFGAETFDTNSNFDPTTNYRFTPTVAGYYQINGQVSLTSGATGYQVFSIYKNGSSIFNNYTVSNTAGPSNVINSIIYCNGSTDYIELYLSQNTGLSQTTNNGSLYSQFSASMVRSA